MLKVFILEDNLQQLAELQTITKQVLAKLNITDSLVFPFSSTSRLTKALPEPSLDNVFILDLSINDNKQAGLQLSQLIRQVDHLATIIFITVHDELLPTTYKYRVQALDFISKDHDNVAHELLTDFHLIAQRKQEAKTDVFSYRIYNQTQTILLDDICYFKSNNGNTHSATIYTIDHRTIEIHQNLHEIGKADKRFFRVHRSYLVNPHTVRNVDLYHRQIEFYNGMICPVSRRKAKGFLKLVLQHKHPHKATQASNGTKAKQVD